MSGPFKNDGTQVHEYVYDVLVDGGAAAAYVLSDKAGADPVPVGAVVKRVTAKVLTALAGGTAVSWGNGDDADGYSGTAIVDASLTINALFNGYDNAAALLWDDTNYHMIDVAILDAADDEARVLTTGTHTAGKLLIMVEYYNPKEAA